MTALDDLAAAGVSIWLDDLGRHRLVSGDLARLIAEQHVVGVTTNPSIFAAAVGDGTYYAEQITELTKNGSDVDEVVQAVVVEDVQSACDLFADTHRATAGVDGRVSLEVDPRLASNTDATVAEARQLWDRVNRPNLMIKIPGTRPGLPAITATLAAGISVNVTLIFGLPRYAEVTDAWLLGLEQAHENGHDLSAIGSVASFFISRFDSAVDRRLDALTEPAAKKLRGRAAIANARLAYAHFEEVLASDRWQRLAALGAHPQRPLWASTSTKDPAYEDTRYVVELVAPNTVNTMPPKTLQAMLDHGELKGRTIGDDPPAERALLDALARLGIGYDVVVDQLEREGVASFEKSWQQFRDSVEQAMERAQA